MHTHLYNLVATTPEGAELELGRWMTARETVALANRFQGEIGDEIVRVDAELHATLVGESAPSKEDIRALSALETAIAA